MRRMVDTFEASGINKHTESAARPAKKISLIQCKWSQSLRLPLPKHFCQGSPSQQGKKTMRRRSEMLINIKCKHQLLCLDRSWSQVRFFIFQPGPLGTPTRQSSLDMPGESNFNSSDNSHVHEKKESSNRWLTWTPVYPIWASLSLILAALPPTWGSELTLQRSAPVHLAGSYDEVGHPGFADPKCLHELLFREGERKLDLCWE